MKYIHYLAGGGLGDVLREAYYNNALGILKRWKLENPTEHLTVLTMSHNPAAADLLTGQDWIDEVAERVFPLEKTWAWESAYTLYESDFWGKTELRFTLPEKRSLYNARWMRGRPFGPQVKMIDPVGVPWSPWLGEYDANEARWMRNRVLVHLGAGQVSRAVPADTARQLVDAIDKRLPPAIKLGANFNRQDHGEESGLALSPRALLAGMANARCVVGAESSVWYLATMLGVPACLLYQADQTYDNVLRGKSDWDWYFNQNPKNLTVKLPLTDPMQIVEWINGLD